MKTYNVQLSYHGSLTMDITAENEKEALEKARQIVESKSDKEFYSLIDVVEDDHYITEQYDDC